MPSTSMARMKLRWRTLGHVTSPKGNGTHVAFKRYFSIPGRRGSQVGFKQQKLGLLYYWESRGLYIFNLCFAVETIYTGTS